MEQLETSENEKESEQEFLVEKLEYNEEKLNQHAERLQHHLQSGAQILKKLTANLTPTERHAQQYALQQHYQEHKELLTAYRDLHNQHNNLLNDFMTAHASILENGPKKDDYLELVKRHQEVLQEHKEKIAEHEDLFNIVPPLN